MSSFSQRNLLRQSNSNPFLPVQRKKELPELNIPESKILLQATQDFSTSGTKVRKKDQKVQYVENPSEITDSAVNIGSLAKGREDLFLTTQQIPLLNNKLLDCSNERNIEDN